MGLAYIPCWEINMKPAAEEGKHPVCQSNALISCYHQVKPAESQILRFFKEFKACIVTGMYNRISHILFDIYLQVSLNDMNIKLYPNILQ